MSAVIESYRGVTCSICIEPFAEGERKWTHEGGEGHDGFHKGCLAQWLNQPGGRSICPFDRHPINRDTLLSRTERITERIMEMLKDGVRTASRIPSLMEILTLPLPQIQAIPSVWQIILALQFMALGTSLVVVGTLWGGPILYLPFGVLSLIVSGVALLTLPFDEIERELGIYQ